VIRTSRFQILLLTLIVLSCNSSLWAAPPPQPFDLVITNGRIIDSTGSPWYYSDIGIRDGKIATIGNLADAHRMRTIEAGGKIVAPGSIGNGA
jgi:N-acyl-D-amino-acid deacylase